MIRYCTNLSSLKLMHVIKVIILNMYEETKGAIARSYYGNMNSTILLKYDYRSTYK